MFRYKTPNLASLFYDSGEFFFKIPPTSVSHYYPHFPIPCCTNLPTTIAPVFTPRTCFFSSPRAVASLSNPPPGKKQSSTSRCVQFVCPFHQTKVNATVTWKTRVYWPVLLDMNCVRGFTAYLLTSLR
ncbi:hypothetical protein CEXT_649291 [Caerostris extrusa]|uniref:Uncharacterized protein n=1 Tax=Caerostris extrusa TaxID=172846 RepID=A0AAV4XYV5_CAEEX|nr:hypothetical protein CEXT_649291 [Caerostris extrusa]